MAKTKKWFYGYELLEILDWTPTELLHHIKNGLPCYNNLIDRQIFDIDSLPRRYKTIEEITEETNKSFELCDPPRPPSSLIEHSFKTQKGTPIYPKDGSEVMNFTLPTGNAEALRLFEKIKAFRFKNNDLSIYLNNNSIHFDSLLNSGPPSTATEAQSAKSMDIESLSMTYISDNEIKIRYSNATKIYDKKQLGFKKQGNSKIWNEFVKALESKDHFYYVGKSKTASYELAQKNLKDINEKLISFFNKEYPFKLPNNFKLYENVKSEKPGTYKFKFAINNPSDINNKYDNLSKDDLISKIEKLSEQFSEYEKNGNDKEADKTNIELSAAVETAMNKGFIGNNRAKGYLFPNRID